MMESMDKVTLPVGITQCSSVIDISAEQDGSLLKEIIKEGEDNAIFPPAGAVVSISFVAKKPEVKVSDITSETGKQISISLGTGAITNELEASICSMKKGETAVFTVDSRYGCPWKKGIVVPTESNYVYEITLFDWTSDLTKNGNGGILKVQTFVKGKGYSVPVNGALCDVHITGKYLDKVFEDRDVKFNLGEGSEVGVITGVEKALKKFLKGEKSLVEIKPKYAYREDGNAELGIPKNATLHYVIELKNFEQPASSWDLTKEEEIEQAKLLNEKANNYFKTGKYQMAKKFYRKMSQYVTPGYDNKYLNDEQKSLFLVAILNLGLTCLKLNDYYLAARICTKALEIDPNNVKGLFRRGQAYLNMGEPEKAKADFEAVLKIETSNKLAANKIIVCSKKIKEQREREKKVCAKMFEKLAVNDEEEKKPNETREANIMENLEEWYEANSKSEEQLEDDYYDSYF